MKKIIKLSFLVSTMTFMPFSAFAAGPANSACFQAFQAGGKLGDLFSYLTCIINNAVIPLIFAIAVAMFIWGVVQYVINDSEEAKKEKGKLFMVWGIIALTVMISVWGLVKIVGDTFNLNTSFIPQVKP